MELEIYLNQQYDFKYNSILNRTLYKRKREKDFKLLQGYDFNSLYREISNKGIKTNLTNLKSLLESDYVKKIDPFKEYFNSLPKWDGKTDYIKKLATMVKTHDDELFHWAFKKWLVAMVACAIFSKSTNHAVLLFTGGQGIGKTTWLTNLMPNELKEYVYSGNINPTNKDSTLMLSERAIINMDELSSYTPSKVEAFKELITKETITERRPYAHFSENYIRRASFCGSANENEVLIDQTGNRRFLVFEVLEKIPHTLTVELENVYSQVMALIQSKFKHYFDLNDIKIIEKNNKNFKQSTTEEDYIDKCFSLPQSTFNKEDIRYMNATEVVEYLINRSTIKIRLNKITIGKILNAKGFQVKKINGIKKYRIKLKR